MAKKSSIGESASKKTKKVFADEISNLTMLTSKEIETLFPEKADKKELQELINIIKADTDDKIKQQKLIDKIGNISGAVLQIAKKFVPGF